MRFSYFIWLIVFWGICIFAIVVAGGNIAWFLSLPSLLFVLAPGVVLSLGPFSFREIVSFFRSAFASQRAEERLLQNALVFFESLGRYVVIGGFVGTIIGAIALLTGLDDPSVVASYVSLALITMLYGLILYTGIVLPFRSAVKKKLLLLENQ